MAAPTTRLPFLESGDRLTREEFHRRYEARPDIKRAELVEGVVYVPSPARFSAHDKPTAVMVAWAMSYAAKHPGVESGANATIILDPHNEVQPDAYIFYSDPSGRGARVNADDYLEGAPQLLVEVTASTASYDLHDKKQAYLRNGVQEYLVWRVLDGDFDWFRPRNGDYVRIEPDEGGIIESEAFPGLRLDVAKLLTGDMAGVLAALES
jgi:Uma2 family endonuclease